jgi:hypothetical protein
MLPCLVTEEDGNMNYGHGWPTGIERVLWEMFEKFLVSALCKLQQKLFRL